MLCSFAALLCLCLASQYHANGSSTRSPRRVFEDLGLPTEAWPAVQSLLRRSQREHDAQKEAQPSERVLQQAQEITNKIVSSHDFNPGDGEELAVFQEDDSVVEDIIDDKTDEEMGTSLLDRDSSIAALQGLQTTLSIEQRWRIIDFLVETAREPQDEDDDGLDTVVVLDHLGLLSTSELLAANLTAITKPDFSSNCNGEWKQWPGSKVSQPTGQPFSTVARDARGTNPTADMIKKGNEVRKRFAPKAKKPALAEVNASVTIGSHGQRHSSRRRTAKSPSRRRRRRRRRRGKRRRRSATARRRSGNRRRSKGRRRRAAPTPTPPATKPPAPAQPPNGTLKVPVAPSKPKEWPNEKAATPPSGTLPKTGCVAQTEWRPVKGSEDCSSRYVDRRDEIPGFTPREGTFTAKDLIELKQKAACGKTCSRKYLIGQYWWPRELQGSGPSWDDAKYWCGNRAQHFGDLVGAVSFYSKNGVCELFSECPMDELEEASEREHQQYELCPLGYTSTIPHKAANGDNLFIPASKDGLCTKGVNPSDAVIKCYLTNSGTVNGMCMGEDRDQHLAIKWCMNGGGEYEGKKGGRHQCFLKPGRKQTVGTWITTHGEEKGRKYRFKEHAKCNMQCGRINTWHIAARARYSRILVLPASQCGECRTQMKFCAFNNDTYTSFAGFTYGGDSEVLTSHYQKMPHKTGEERKKEKRAYICCNVHQCSSSINGDWKDANHGKKPCEENPGNIRIKNQLGVNQWIYGRYTALKIEGNSTASSAKDGNKCFQLKKYFRPHSDWVHWVRTGESKEQLCYPRHEEVPVKGSDVCQDLSSASKCLSKPGVCKWIPPDQGECKPKVVAGSEHCESPATTCPSGGHDGKPCEPPAASTGCEYPWYAESMKDLPKEARRFTETGEPKTHAVLVDEDVGSWAGLRGSTAEFNTTWHTLQEHGWKGGSGKCVTKVYSTHWNNRNGRILGYACKAKPIENPNMSWNGEPCLKASTKKQCAVHSDVCDWKPGPKCEFRLFHEMQLRCLHCKEFHHNNKYSNWQYKADLSAGRGKGSWCQQCTKWQLYYSKAKSELACHILQHFHGLGPEITSRIDVLEGFAGDHGKSPPGDMEFLFDGKRTCVRAFGGGVKDAKQKNGRESNVKGSPSKEALSHQLETFHKSSEVCQGGIWRRWTYDTRKHTWIKQNWIGNPDNKRRMEISGSAWSSGPWFFERCGWKTEGSSYWKDINEANFYETMEALSEAVKNGGVHPECPVPDRAVSDEPPVTHEAASALNTWEQKNLCSVVNKEGRRDAAEEPESPTTPPQPDQPRAKGGCKGVKMAQASRAHCETLYEMKGTWKAPCVWVPNAAPSPYGGRCFPCDEVGNIKDSPKIKLSKCGPEDNDQNKPNKCHADCVIPATWPSRQSFTQYAPCTKFLNPWGFCGCGDKFQNQWVGGQQLKGIDCRGCSESAIKRMLGQPCSQVAPNISPALCLALQALGVDDTKIGKITVQPHWAHGGQYYFGDTATCIAAGQPQHSCAGSSCFPITKNKNLQCRSALYCTGGENVIASGLVKEDSYTTGSSYGSWAAQARQLARAIQNGGEHPTCIAATVRAGTKPPCLEEPPDTSFRKWPSSWADEWWHPTVTKKICDEKFRHAYPAALPGPDTFAKPWWITEKFNAAFCKKAGYPMDMLSKWGPDSEDKKYMYQDYMLYHTDVFGRGICSEHNKIMCGGLSTTQIGLSIPGCRKDAFSKVWCSNSKGSLKGSQCLCGNLAKKESEPNTLLSSLGAAMTGNTCNKAEMEQGVFECFGMLAGLKPGKDNKYGFRCKTDEAITEPWSTAWLTTKYECPPGSKGLSGWCGQHEWRSHRAFGRFTPGSDKTAACVRQVTRCNGVCNCGDCSDEDGCDDLLTLVR